MCNRCHCEACLAGRGNLIRFDLDYFTEFILSKVEGFAMTFRRLNSKS